jgi:hypothetical protein
MNARAAPPERFGNANLDADIQRLIASLVSMPRKPARRAAAKKAIAPSKIAARTKR